MDANLMLPFAEICRACLNQNKTVPLQSLFVKRNDTFFSNIFVEVTSIQIISEDNRLPTSICSNCLERLENAYDFKLLCLQSDRLLKQAFANDQTKFGLSEALDAIKTEHDEKFDHISQVPIVQVNAGVDYESSEAELKTEWDSVDDPSLLPSIPKIKIVSKRVTNDEQILSCEICSGSYVGIKNLRRHKRRRNHYTDGELALEKNPELLYTRVLDSGKHLCTICKQEFSYKHTIIRHFKRRHEAEMKAESNPKVKLEPDAFYEILQSSTAETVEIGDLKTMETVHACTICSKKFSSVHSLRKHQRRNQHWTEQQIDRRKRLSLEKRNENGKFPCTDCNKEFRNRGKLRWHQAIHRNETFTCTQCNKNFIRKRNLDVHMRLHTGEARGTCHLCGKQFHDRNILLTHMKIHMAKRFKCEVCAREFAQNKTLKNHMRTHTGERPFTCDICQKSFNRRHILKTHKMTHTDERPFVCTLCPRAFRSKQQLNFHMERHPVSLIC